MIKLLSVALQLDQFFIDSTQFSSQNGNPFKALYGYMRTVVTRFRKGSAHADDPDKSYVKAVVQHQFRSDCDSCLDLNFDCSDETNKCIQKVLKEMMEDAGGKLDHVTDTLTLELSNSAWNMENAMSVIKRMLIYYSSNILQI